MTVKSVLQFLGSSEWCLHNDNIYIDMQAGRNFLPKLPVADN